MKAQKNLNIKISILKQTLLQREKKNDLLIVLLLLFFIPNLSQAQINTRQRLISPPIHAFEFSNLQSFWSPRNTQGGLLQSEKSKANGEVNFSLLQTFQHWQTFRQTEAFRPNLEQDKGLTYQYQPTSFSNCFNIKPTTEFSSFLQLQQTPGYLEFNELGFFCTLDLKLDLTMKIPFRFRLGTLDTVNRKEGYYD